MPWIGVFGKKRLFQLRQEFPPSSCGNRFIFEVFFPFQILDLSFPHSFDFIEHNDSNRALMSSNMQRQAVPISRSEKWVHSPKIEERQAALDSGALAIAEHEGKIIYTDTDKILFFSQVMEIV